MSQFDLPGVYSPFGDGDRPAPIPGLLRRRYGTESVIWADGGAPMYLDPLASLTLDLLDGEASVAELVHDVHDVVGVPEAIAHRQIHRSLSVLASAGALVGTVPAQPNTDLFHAPLNH